MFRVLLPILILVVTGMFNCNKDNSDGGNTINAPPPPDVIGVWTVDFFLSPDSTIHFSVNLSSDSTDTMLATADIRVGFLPLTGIAVYWEAGVWKVRNDSIVVSRTNCAVMDSIEFGLPVKFVWDTISCTPVTATLPINISGNTWTVKFRDLQPYVPPDITVPGFAADAEVVLTRKE